MPTPAPTLRLPRRDAFLSVLSPSLTLDEQELGRGGWRERGGGCSSQLLGSKVHMPQFPQLCSQKS